MQKLNETPQENIKTRKAFGKLDFILYLTLALLLFLLFLFFVILPSRSPAKGFKVTVGETIVFNFYYQDCSYDITDGYDVKVKETDGVYEITVTTPAGYNVIQTKPSEGYVKVVDANCSIGKDCVYTAPIKTDGGAIVCLPHDLRVLPIGGTTPPIAG